MADVTTAYTPSLRGLLLADLNWRLEQRRAGRGPAIARVHLPCLASMYPSREPAAYVDFLGRLTQREAVVSTQRAIRANDTHLA